MRLVGMDENVLRWLQFVPQSYAAVSIGTGARGDKYEDGGIQLEPMAANCADLPCVAPSTPGNSLPGSTSMCSNFRSVGRVATQYRSPNSTTTGRQRVNFMGVGAISGSATKRSHASHAVLNQERLFKPVYLAPPSASSHKQAALSAQGSGILQSRLERYGRRKRHKTRHDKYEFKGATTMVAGEPPTQRAQRRERDRTRRNKTGAMLNAEFVAPNVEADRLTLDRKNGIGFLDKRKSSLKLDYQDLPDLTFSNMRFLAQGRQSNQAGKQSLLTSRAQINDKMWPMHKISSSHPFPDGGNRAGERESSLIRGTHEDRPRKCQVPLSLTRERPVQYSTALHRRQSHGSLHLTANVESCRMEATQPRSSRFEPTLPTSPNLKNSGTPSPLHRACPRETTPKQLASRKARVDGRSISLSASDCERPSLREYAMKAVIRNQPGVWRNLDETNSSQKVYSLESLKDLADSMKQRERSKTSGSYNTVYPKIVKQHHDRSSNPENNVQTDQYNAQRASEFTFAKSLMFGMHDSNRTTSKLHQQRLFEIDDYERNRLDLMARGKVETGWHDIRKRPGNRIDSTVPNSMTMLSPNRALDLVDFASGQHSSLNMEGVGFGHWPRCLSVEASDVTFSRIAWLSDGRHIDSMPRARTKEQTPKTDEQGSRFSVLDTGFEQRHNALSVCLDEFDASLLLEASEIQAVGSRGGVETSSNSMVESQIQDQSRTNRPTLFRFADARHTDTQSQRGEAEMPWVCQNDFQPFTDRTPALKLDSTLLHVSDVKPWHPAAGKPQFPLDAWND